MNTKSLNRTALALLLLAGCASQGITQVGPDTYMVSRGGWPAMNGFKAEAKCYKAANDFCAKRGLTMQVVTITTIDGADFQHNASSKLVFRAVPPK